VADTVTANAFTTVEGDSLADVQAAIDRGSNYIRLKPGTTYTGDTTVTLSDGSGPNGQRTFVDARGTVLNYTGDGKRCVEVLPVGAVEGIPGPDRNTGDGTREARNISWIGGTVYGPGSDVENSAAFYAEDMFGCDITLRGVGQATNGVWVRNKHYWSESNHIKLRGRRAVRGKDITTGGLSDWAVRLDGGPASDDLNGTLSYRTSDVEIDWISGGEGYLWLNGASMHGGRMLIRGFLPDGGTGLRVTGGGWNMSSKVFIEHEGGGENAEPVYIGPNANPPLFIGPRIGHPSTGHFGSEDTIVNESSNPVVCLMHDGIYNEYTEKLVSFKDKEPSLGGTVDVEALSFNQQNLLQARGDSAGEMRGHDGSGDHPAGMYLWDANAATWQAMTGEATIQPEVAAETGAEADATITIQDNSFQPHTVEIDAGDTVAWVNEDDTGHHIVTNSIHQDQLWTENAEVWAIDRQLAAGERTTNTFEDAGVYEFKSQNHDVETMCGAVSVGGVAIEGSLPCE
jgi:plastocyanin